MFNFFKKNKKVKVHTYKLTYQNGDTEMVVADELEINNIVVNEYDIVSCEKIN